MITAPSTIPDDPESGKTILRFATDCGHLTPKCSFWVGFAGDGPGIADTLATQATPQEVLNLGLEQGMSDTPASIFSSSTDSERWLVFLTRDLPQGEAPQARWVNQLTALLGQWETPSVGISLSPSIVDSFLNHTPSIHRELVIKAIHGLNNLYQIQNFYFYVKEMDPNKATNFLLVIRNLLKTAKISSTVFH